MGNGMMGGWGKGWLMLAYWILVLIGLFLLIRWLLQLTGREKNVVNGSVSALEILKQRYAGGGIDLASVWLKVFIHPAFFWLHFPGGILFGVIFVIDSILALKQMWLPSAIKRTLIVYDNHSRA